MRFSIIVPVYNVAQYLGECVDSLLDQVGEDYEILLVDDGSTDGSGALCDGYYTAFPEKIRVIHQPNGGLGAARNTGIENARGEYLLFIDSDDAISRDTLACLSRKIDESHADMYIFGLQYWTDGVLTPGEPLPDVGKAPVTLAQRPQLLLATPSVCVRCWHRSLFEVSNIRFPSRVWYEDLHTTPKIMPLCRSIVVMQDPFYHYRLRQGSIMRNANLIRNLEILDALEQVRRFYEDNGLMHQCGEWFECMAVEHVTLAAQRVLMADPEAAFLPKFHAWLEQTYPHHAENTLLGKKRRLVLALLERRQYRLLRLMFTLRQKLRVKNS